MKHNLLVSIIKTPKVVIREYLHRLPEAGFSWQFCDSPAVEQILSQLRQDGIALLPGYFQGERLRRLQSAFEQALKIRGEDAGNPAAAASFNLMDLDPVFLEAATDAVLLEVIARYYRRRFGIGRADALRIEPLANARAGSFQWHHDSRGKQVKIQVLLTDVNASDQRMTYLRQSHHRYYSYYRSRGEGSRFELDVQANPEQAARMMDAVGPAGTVGIFDTNGLHSGNRNESRRRDVLTFYYPTRESRNYRALQYRREDVAKLGAVQQQVITYNPLHKFVD